VRDNKKIKQEGEEEEAELVSNSSGSTPRRRKVRPEQAKDFVDIEERRLKMELEFEERREQAEARRAELMAAQSHNNHQAIAHIIVGGIQAAMQLYLAAQQAPQEKKKKEEE
jgi:hypothetical protein